MYKDVKKRRENQSKWIRKNTKGFYIRLSLEKDADIIKHLASKENKQGYVKQLIRNDMVYSEMVKPSNDHAESMKKFDENFKRGLEEGLRGE